MTASPAVPVALSCPVTGKHAYPTRLAADAVRRAAHSDPSWDASIHGGLPERVYQCPYCEWWHLTKHAKRRHL